MTTTTNPVTWFEIATADPGEATTFYGELFGWSFSADEAAPSTRSSPPAAARVSRAAWPPPTASGRATP